MTILGDGDPESGFPVVADVCYQTFTREANARLIALAPTLAAALIEARDALDDAPCTCETTVLGRNVYESTCARCAAIARIDSIAKAPE